MEELQVRQSPPARCGSAAAMMENQAGKSLPIRSGGVQVSVEDCQNGHNHGRVLGQDMQVVWGRAAREHGVQAGSTNKMDVEN